MLPYSDPTHSRLSFLLYFGYCSYCHLLPSTTEQGGQTSLLCNFQTSSGNLFNLFPHSWVLAPVGYQAGAMLVSVQFSSVTQSCPTLCDPMNRSTPGLPVHHQLPEFTQTHVHDSLMPSSHLILCCPLLLLPPTPPSIRVFSSESTLHIRWPKYWSFSFNISSSNEHPGLISFRMD